MRFAATVLSGTLIAAALAPLASVATTGPAVRLERGRTIDVGGVTRRYNVQRARPSNQKAPLVLVFHGNGGSADGALGLGRVAAPSSRWLELGARDGFVVAALDGSVGSDGRQGWNDCRADATTSSTTDDVAFADAVIDELVRAANVDPARVYAVGMSNGAMFTLRLALERADRFAGFGAVAGALPGVSKCTDTGVRRPIVMINGTKDTFVPFNGGDVAGGGGRGTTTSVSATVDAMVKRNRAATPSQRRALPDRDRRDGSTATLQTFAASGPETAAVFAITLDGAGHTEPSIAHRYGPVYERLVGPQNRDFESADLIWELLTR